MVDRIFAQKPELEDLAHYGVKGMKWGVRNDKTKARKQAKKLKKYGPNGTAAVRTPAQNKARQERAANRTSMFLITMYGSLYVASYIARSRSRGSSRAYNAPRYKKPSTSVKDIINDERKVKVDAIQKTFREGYLDEAQRKQFTDSINKRYDRKIKEALSDL